MLTLSNSPVLISHLPSEWLENALQHAKKDPLSGNYSTAATVAAALKERNIENGIRQIRLETTIPDGDWRRTDFSRPGGEGHYVYFSVDPQFASFGSRVFEITAVVRRVAPDKVAGMSIDYESSRGYVGAAYRNISEGGGWQELSWSIKDASFVGAWGWNFRLNGISSPNDFLIKEVRVSKAQ
jgi:polysaccharide biosynthesis protein PslG